MKQTLFGLIVVALVVVGVFLARGWGRSASDPGILDPGPRDSASGSASPEAWSPEAWSPGPFRPGVPSLPDVTLEDAAIDLGPVRVTLSISPRPAVALAKTRFRVRVESGGALQVLDGGRISFEMTMPMGDHRYTLVPGADGWQEAEVVLPMCQSGNPRWYAIVEGTVTGRTVMARFRLDLAKPGTAPSS